MRDTIVVIGDVMLDRSYKGSVERISPEAPIPIFKKEESFDLLGGAANVALNISSLGENVALCSSHNLDYSGNSIISLAKQSKIDYFRCNTINRKTTTKTRHWALGQQVSRIDDESFIKLENQEFNQIRDFLISKINNTKLLVISDYDKGIITRELIEYVIELAKINNIEVVCDPKIGDPSKYESCTYITPNQKELSYLVQNHIKEIDFDKEDLFIEESLRILKERYNIKNPVVTLGSKGIAFLENNKLSVQPTLKVNVADPTGAGDTALAGFASAISNKLNLRESIRWAVASSSQTVQEIGVAKCQLYKLQSSLNSLPSITYSVDANIANNSFKSSRKIAPIISDTKKLNELIYIYRKNNSKILFTNGCFDLMHFGHIAILEYASSIADIIIVGVNSDSSIKKLKGKSRPINNFISRSSILASLSYVDYVIPFDQETPLEIIKSIRPNILLKGGDYTKDQVIGKEYSDNVIIFERVNEFSTTEILNAHKEKSMN